MIPGFDLVQFAQTAGPITAVIVVAAIIFSESGLFIGFFLPGDSILFTLGFLLQSAESTSPLANINIAVAVLFVAATLGYNIGYLFGRKIGPMLFRRPNSMLFRQDNVQKAQDFYDKYGGKTIILARFIPIVRTFVPLIAGVAKMEYKTFMTYNVIGGLLWTSGVTYTGYFLGKWLTRMGIEVDTILLPIVLAILVLSVLPAAYHLLKDKKQRAVIWDATKLQVKKILKRK
jgi:membrane-associated protein